MARYTFGYTIFKHEGSRRDKYAELIFQLKVVNEKCYPLRKDDTVATLRWIANKDEPQSGWIGPTATIEMSTGWSDGLDRARVGLKLLERLAKKWGYAPLYERGDNGYWMYTQTLFQQPDKVMEALAELRDNYEEGRVSWLEPYFLVLYAFPAMKIGLYFNDPRLSDLVPVDELEPPDVDKWMDWWRDYGVGDTSLDGVAVTCLARDENVAKAKLEVEFFSRTTGWGYPAEKWEARRQAWLDAGRPVINMRTYASWNYKIPYWQGFEHALRIPSK